MILRDYQHAAVDAVYEHLRSKENNPCVVIPTGGGKTPVLATIVKDSLLRWNGRVLILSHVKELLQQAVEKISQIAPEVDIGVYSAGLNSRDTGHNCIVGGIQSVYKQADALGKFDLIIVDEAHLIPEDGEGMYRTFLDRMREINPIVRLIGLTATPYRMTSGMICAGGNILNEVCYEIGVKQLISEGYLCKLSGKATRKPVDMDSLHIRGGEFIPGETEDLMDKADLVKQACHEIIGYAKERKSVLIFCCGITHAMHVCDRLRNCGEVAETVFGDTLPQFREQYLEDFKAGKIKYLVNVGVLTTGFDVPNVDCVVLLRPTNSPGLYYQMVGRGFRIHPDKTDCLILDFGGNIMRHGPVDMLDIKDGKRKTVQAAGKTCKNCQEVVHISCRICPECGTEFSPGNPQKPTHDGEAATLSVLSGEAGEMEYPVLRVRYYVHEKRDAEPGTPRTMRIEYQVATFQYFSEWVCPEHSGYARTKFIKWWTEHSPGCDIPRDAQEAVWLAAEGALDCPVSIKVRTISGEKYPKIIEVKYPERIRASEAGPDEIPF